MTLSFSTKWPARMQSCAVQPNYFIQKIWKAIPDATLGILSDYYSAHMDKFGYCWDTYQPPRPKLHTIRRGHRWKPGMKIHMVINNRTPRRFQFAPVIRCVSVQDIEIKEKVMTPFPCYKTNDQRVFTVNVDGKYLIGDRIMDIAINDGFDSADHFFEYFNEDFEGQIIHWTPLRY